MIQAEGPSAGLCAAFDAFIESKAVAARPQSKNRSFKALRFNFLHFDLVVVQRHARGVVDGSAGELVIKLPFIPRGALVVCTPIRQQRCLRIAGAISAH